eukprot:jgi/Tetstr1/420312/TSEL_011433.t1
MRVVTAVHMPTSITCAELEVADSCWWKVERARRPGGGHQGLSAGVAMVSGWGQEDCCGWGSNDGGGDLFARRPSSDGGDVQLLTSKAAEACDDAGMQDMFRHMYRLNLSACLIQECWRAWRARRMAAEEEGARRQRDVLFAWADEQRRTWGPQGPAWKPSRGSSGLFSSFEAMDWRDRSECLWYAAKYFMDRGLWAPGRKGALTEAQMQELLALEAGWRSAVGGGSAGGFTRFEYMSWASEFVKAGSGHSGPSWGGGAVQRRGRDSWQPPPLEQQAGKEPRGAPPPARRNEFPRRDSPHAGGGQAAPGGPKAVPSPSRQRSLSRPKNAASNAEPLTPKSQASGERSSPAGRLGEGATWRGLATEPGDDGQRQEAAPPSPSRQQGAVEQVASARTQGGVSSTVSPSASPRASEIRPGLQPQPQLQPGGEWAEAKAPRPDRRGRQSSASSSTGSAASPRHGLSSASSADSSGQRVALSRRRNNREDGAVLPALRVATAGASDPRLAPLTGIAGHDWQSERVPADQDGRRPLSPASRRELRHVAAEVSEQISPEVSWFEPPELPFSGAVPWGGGAAPAAPPSSGGSSAGSGAVSATRGSPAPWQERRAVLSHRPAPLSPGRRPGSGAAAVFAGGDPVPRGYVFGTEWPLFDRNCMCGGTGIVSDDEASARVDAYVMSTLDAHASAEAGKEAARREALLDARREARHSRRAPGSQAGAIIADPAAPVADEARLYHGRQALSPFGGDSQPGPFSSETRSGRRTVGSWEQMEADSLDAARARARDQMLDKRRQMGTRGGLRRSKSVGTMLGTLAGMGGPLAAAAAGGGGGSCALLPAPAGIRTTPARAARAGSLVGSGKAIPGLLRAGVDGKVKATNSTRAASQLLSRSKSAFSVGEQQQQQLYSTGAGQLLRGIMLHEP